jgi:Ca-activated chloride channel homolog
MRLMAFSAILVAGLTLSGVQGPVALLTSTALAQDRPFDSPPEFSEFSRLAQDRPTFRSRAELVVLHVSVRDGSGRYITGLPKEAFTVIDDGKPQTLEMFSADEVPATVGFLIDNSNSMRPSRERVIASAVSFLNNSHPKDEVFVLTFNETVRRAWAPSIVDEMDAAAFSKTINAEIVGRGMTAIYDGILAGLDWLTRARHTRQVLVVVSDGGDNASSAKVDDVLKRVRDSDATVYTVAMLDSLMTRDGNPKLLKRLAKATGGEFYEPRKLDDVPEAFEKIAKDIRSAYTIAYVPTAGGDGAAERRRRTVRVYVRSQDGHALKVRTRDGYFEKNTSEDRQ